MRYDTNWELSKSKLPVNVGNREIKGLCLEFVFLPNFNKPVNKNRPHSLVDVGLLGHVIVLGHVLDFALS